MVGNSVNDASNEAWANLIELNRVWVGSEGWTRPDGRKKLGTSATM